MSLRSRYRLRRARKVYDRVFGRPNDTDTKLAFKDGAEAGARSYNQQHWAVEDDRFERLFRELGALSEGEERRKLDGTVYYARG